MYEVLSLNDLYIFEVTQEQDLIKRNIQHITFYDNLIWLSIYCICN